jgi:hypothetical protein
MDNKDNNLELIFDIKAAYDTINYMDDDFDIIIQIKKNGKLVQSFFSPMSTPEELFSTFKDVIEGKEKEIMISPEEFGPDIKINRIYSDFNSIYFIVIPPTYHIPPSYKISERGYIKLSDFEKTFNKLFPEDINSYEFKRWKSEVRMEPPINEVTITLHPKPYGITISKKKYTEAILDLFEKYAEVVQKNLDERCQKYDKNEDYKRYFSMIEDK